MPLARLPKVGREEAGREETAQEASEQEAAQEIQSDTAEPTPITLPAAATPNTNTATPATTTQPSTTATTPTIAQTTTPTASTGKAFVFPDGTTNIAARAYAGSTYTSVTIPNSVTTIENGVFARCTSLASVTIPDSVTKIGQGAFFFCNSLASVTFQHNASTTIDNADAFPGDLVTKSGGTGNYNRYGTWVTTSPGYNSSWTKN